MTSLAGMVAPRVPPIAEADWPPELDAMRGGFAGKLNVYGTMAHDPALLVAWENLRNHVVLDSALPPDAREIVILRVGHHWRSEYELAQHIIRGRAAGLSDARIAACTEALQGAATDRPLIAAVDALLTDARLAPDLLADLETAFGRPAVFDLMATVGMYTTLAFIANSFATPIEADITARLTERPLDRG